MQQLGKTTQGGVYVTIMIIEDDWVQMRVQGHWEAIKTAAYVCTAGYNCRFNAITCEC